MIHVPSFICRSERRASSPKSWKMPLKEMSTSSLFSLPPLASLVLFGLLWLAVYIQGVSFCSYTFLAKEEILG